MEPTTIIQDIKELQAHKRVRKVLLICGILSMLLYVGADILAAMLYEGYSYTSQTISELSAIGAPTRPLLALTGIVYLFLVVAFGLVGFAWPFAPMHQREVLAAGEGTLSDTMHLILSAVDSLLFLLIIGFGAAAFGKRFRLLVLAIILLQEEKRPGAFR